MLDARYSISNRKGGREKFKYINGAIGFDPSTMLRAGRLTINFAPYALIPTISRIYERWQILLKLAKKRVRHGRIRTYALYNCRECSTN
jgi:hypothetical protein